MRTEQEEWRPAYGFENSHEVSNRGNIRSVDRVVKKKTGEERFYKGQPVSVRKDSKGYASLRANVAGKLKRAAVHRLVAIAFIPNPENKPQVNHLNGEKMDNNVSNLEWCTAKENLHHAWRTGLARNPTVGMFGGDHPLSKSVDVFEVYLKKIDTLGSVTEASKKYSIIPSMISNHTRGLTHKIGTLTFRREGDVDIEGEEMIKYSDLIDRENKDRPH